MSRTTLSPAAPAPMIPLTDEEWAATWEPGDAIDEALLLGVIDAARRHLAAGVPMVIWRDGRIVHVPAAEVLAELGAPIADVTDEPQRKIYPRVDRT